MIGLVVLGIVCVGLYWLMYRAARVPRTKLKIPRDRSRDTRTMFYIGL